MSVRMEISPDSFLKVHFIEENKKEYVCLQNISYEDLIFSGKLKYTNLTRNVLKHLYFT